MTQSQIDKLGERLRVEHRDEGMVRLLDALYDNYESAATRIGAILLEFIAAHGFEEEPIFARRPTKSIQSIVAKLNRERTRLSKMQDIVGCRIIVQNRAEQSVLRGGLNQADVWSQLDIAKGAVRSRGPLGKTSVVDRNLKPRNGYRAVHVIASDFGAPYEIQIRTALQNRWAQLCERLDDKFPGLKYGQGPAYWRKARFEGPDRCHRVGKASRRRFASRLS